jgi:SAM-dependent methyltransferase
MNPFTWFYYRYIFLRENRIARTIASQLRKPKVPSRETWEAEYQSGSWGRLYDLSEQAHNAIVLSYVASLGTESSVLEIGCGEGILLRRLRQIGYRSYTGLDLSDVAIGRCLHFRDSKTSLIAGDAERYVPDGQFDAIVLNECIYYFAEPVATVQRYVEYLTPGGVFVISIFDSVRTRPILRRLKELFSLVDETAVSNSKGTWHCLMLSPRSLRRSLARPAPECSGVQEQAASK